MMKVKANLSTKPKYENGYWHFKLWNARERQEIFCVSSIQFAIDSRSGFHELKPSELEPGAQLEVSGTPMGPSTLCFDYLVLLE